MEELNTKDDRYLVDLTVLDTMVEVATETGMEPRTVSNKKIYFSSSKNFLDEYLSDAVREDIERYQKDHLDEDGDFRV